MTQSQEVMTLPPALLKQFADMVTIIPDFEPGGGESIIAQILGAKTLADIDAPWTGGRKAPVGPILFIVGVSKAPSDFDGGLPFYLIIETFLPMSGEIKEYSVGGTMVVAQLVKTFVQGDFPVAGTIVEKALRDRPGQSAQHFAVDHDETARLRKAYNKPEAK